MIVSTKRLCTAVATALAMAVSAHAKTAPKAAQATDKPKATVTTAREASSGMATGREAQSGQANGAQSTAKSSAHATEVIEYKDPEDMTTRTRPGNNQTTKAGQTSGSDSGSSAAAHAAAKQTGIPACDGASKDAAKCAATTSSGQQSSTHVNKVDSFTVKQ